MRELYMAPELKLISFVPHENIAVFSFDFDDANNGIFEPSSTEYDSCCSRDLISVEDED